MSYTTLDSKKDEESVSKSSCKSILSLSLLLASVFIVPLSPSHYAKSTFNQRVVTDWALLMFPQLLHSPSILPFFSSSLLILSHVPSAISCIEIGGILGTLWCGGPSVSPSRLGYVSDAYHLSRAHICEASSIMAGVVFAVLPSASSPLSFVLLAFLLGFFLYIPFSFSELIAMESVDAQFTNTVISMNGLMSPFGSVFSGLPVDWVILTFGWKCLPSLVCVCFCSFALLLWANHFVQRRMNERKDLSCVCGKQTSQSSLEHCK